jgi:hypothetical protein
VHGCRKSFIDFLASDLHFKFSRLLKGINQKLKESRYGSQRSGVTMRYISMSVFSLLCDIKTTQVRKYDACGQEIY